MIEHSTVVGFDEHLIIEEKAKDFNTNFNLNLIFSIFFLILLFVI